MKKSIIYFALAAMLMSACESDDKTYTDSTKIRFSESEVNYQINPFATDVIEIDIPISLIGKSIADMPYNIRISRGAESIPMQIVSYADNGNMLAGKYSDIFPISVKSSEMSENSNIAFTLSLITDNDNNVAHNYDTCNITIHKQRLVDFFLGKYDCYETSISGNYATNFVADGKSDTTILNTNFWNFNAAGANVKYVLNRKNQTITIPLQEWTDSAKVQHEVYGSGKYFADGSMSVDYTITTNQQVIETATHRFTKIK